LPATSGEIAEPKGPVNVSDTVFEQEEWGLLLLMEVKGSTSLAAFGVKDCSRMAGKYCRAVDGQRLRNDVAILDPCSRESH